MLRQNNKSQGQALVEFALIITVLLMMIFLIVESARILQGWVTVQNAARVGARYAITGQNDSPCATSNIDKYVDRCDDLRVASVISITHSGLAGLPLNEDPTSNPFRYEDGSPPDENSYYIEVYGGYVDENGAQIREDFAGSPGQPVVVRAVYNVPIITPFFKPLIPVIPVFGQVTMNNENFGSLGNPTQGLGLPPEMPPLATVGASPTPSATPSETPTSTAGPTTTATATPSNTPSATPDYCGAYFETAPVEGQTHVWVSGEVGDTVTIIDLTTGQTLGTDTFLAASDHQCAGFADFNGANALISPLVFNHVILAVPNQGQPDTAIVLQGTPTPTPSPTNVVPPTSTATNTPTVTPTSTPSGPYITLIPNCSIGSNAQFNVLGFNWPTNQSIALSWNGSPQSIIPSGHPGSFSQNWIKSNLIVGTTTNPTLYTVRAQTNTSVATAVFKVPCENIPAPTSQPTMTPTPNPADLIVVGAPELISTRPLVAYQPISMRVTISNTGEIDVSSSFFVDIYFDPTGPVSPTIGISQSVGYMAVSSLAGGATRVLTITAPLGFHNPPPEPHMAYAMVDSLEDITESDETNNVSLPLTVEDVTPAATPTPSPTPVAGSEMISGIVWVRIGNWVPQSRTTVRLIDEVSGLQINSTTTDKNGMFQFMAPAGTYTLRSCTQIDNITLSGFRVGITSPNNFADIYMLPGACP
ncbi:MAG: pilus assembly protein [Ardenticatenaceae bacterium]|nr:pilus assembly protein [Ardenticatenaceae bacterium]